MILVALVFLVLYAVVYVSLRTYKDEPIQQGYVYFEYVGGASHWYAVRKKAAEAYYLEIRVNGHRAPQHGGTYYTPNESNRWVWSENSAMAGYRCFEPLERLELWFRGVGPHMLSEGEKKRTFRAWKQRGVSVPNQPSP